MSEKPDRPIFVGNFEYDAEEKEVVSLFERYGRVDRIDMKSGYAFVYMESKRDGEDAIRKLDDQEFGYKRRRLKVQWAKQAEADRKRDVKPSRCLFVVNFDPTRVRERDLEKHFDFYGPITRVEIKKNYAFVQFDNVEDSVKAQAGCNAKMMMGRTITCEFVQNENPFQSRADGGGGGGGGGGRVERADPPRARSRSPPPRRRSRSPVYEKSRRSPSPRRGGGGGGRSRSPPPRRRASPSPRRGGGGGRSRSPPPQGGRSRSPPRRSARSPSPYRSSRR